MDRKLRTGVAAAPSTGSAGRMTRQRFVMRRGVPALLVGVMLVATAGFCDTPRPPGWQAPVIESVVTSPEQVAAGSTFRVTVEARDDKLVRGVSVHSFRAPDGSGPYLDVSCTEPTFEVGWTPQQHVSVDFDCSMPGDALNGTWSGRVMVWDGECTRFCSAETELLVEVVGGTDGAPPQLPEEVGGP